MIWRKRPWWCPSATPATSPPSWPGFLRLHDLKIIETLPRVIGVQSRHADPVFRYYLEPDKTKRVFVPVTVQASVAQAAMIGNPVSMPRVIRLAEEYHRRAGEGSVAVVHVSEQEIMDSMLLANRHGHISCTQGGESLAGLRAALQEGLLSQDEIPVLDATAHHLKFIGFQQMYFEDSFPPEFEVTPRPEYQNRPQFLTPATDKPEEKTADLAGQIAAVAGVDPERLAGLPHRWPDSYFLFKAGINSPRRRRCKRPELWAMSAGGQL